MSAPRPVASQEAPTPHTVPPAVAGPAAPPPPVQASISEFAPRKDDAIAVPAMPPRTDKLAPRSRARAPVPADNADQNAILQIVSGIPVHQELSESVTSKVYPSSLALFQIVLHMDNLMTVTHRFLQSAPTWHPIVTHLYFSLLFFFQVLRAQRESGELGFQLMELLNTIEQYFDFRSLAIPGPLVHFFSALSVAAPADELFGNVTVALPHNCSVRANGCFLLHNNLHARFPDVPFLLDIFNRQIFGRNQAPGDNVSYDMSNLFGSALNSNTVYKHHLRCPNYWYLADVPASIWQSCYSHRSLMRLPPNIDATTRQNSSCSWGQFLRLQPFAHETLPDWFSPIVTIMQRYCGFFSGSRSLADVPATSNGSLFLEIDYCPEIQSILDSDPAPAKKSSPKKTPEGSSPPPPEPTTPSPTIQRLPGLAATARHAHRDLPLLHLQIGALTQVNASEFGTYTGALDREGPYWQTRPYYQYVSKFDYSRIIGGNLVDHYHKDTRQ